MIYLRLFMAFLWVGLTSFGGGYAALASIEQQTVGNNWLSTEEFADIIAISQTTPGPIGINAATFCGAKVAGVPGAVCATLGCVTPSGIIVLTLAVLYRKYSELKPVQHALTGLRPAATGLIASAGLSLCFATLFSNELPRMFSPDLAAALTLFATALVILRVFKLNQVWVILGSGGLWAIWTAVKKFCLKL
ncbi:MAG: chromate transporter [Oscillospiraceae bacterium]|nr:chromate transporter [Oscillospiraceae bacterium]